MSNYKKMTKEQLIAKYENMTKEQLIAKIKRLEKSKKEVERYNHMLEFDNTNLNNLLESIQDLLERHYK